MDGFPVIAGIVVVTIIILVYLTFFSKPPTPAANSGAGGACKTSSDCVVATPMCDDGVCKAPPACKSSDDCSTLPAGWQVCDTGALVNGLHVCGPRVSQGGGVPTCSDPTKDEAGCACPAEGVAGNGACQPNATMRCIGGADNVTAWQCVCNDGYRQADNGTCEKITAKCETLNCVDADECPSGPGSCTRCAEGYGPQGGPFTFNGVTFPACSLRWWTDVPMLADVEYLQPGSTNQSLAQASALGSAVTKMECASCTEDLRTGEIVAYSDGSGPSGLGGWESQANGSIDPNRNCTTDGVCYNSCTVAGYDFPACGRQGVYVSGWFPAAQFEDKYLNDGTYQRYYPLSPAAGPAWPKAGQDNGGGKAILGIGSSNLAGSNWNIWNDVSWLAQTNTGVQNQTYLDFAAAISGRS